MAFRDLHRIAELFAGLSVFDRSAGYRYRGSWVRGKTRRRKSPEARRAAMAERWLAWAEANPEKARARYAKWKRANRAAVNAGKARKRAERREAGLCTHCSSGAVVGRSMCSAHLERHRAKMATKRRKHGAT